MRLDYLKEMKIGNLLTTAIMTSVGSLLGFFS